MKQMTIVLVAAIFAIICGVVLLLEVRNPATIIALGLIASGVGLAIIATGPNAR